MILNIFYDIRRICEKYNKKKGGKYRRIRLSILDLEADLEIVLLVSPLEIRIVYIY